MSSDRSLFYNVRCASCGEYDVIPGGMKTHKCSHCGYRNTLNYDDPSTTINNDYNPFQPQFLTVICPYCGYNDIVPFEEKIHRCPMCRLKYEVAYDDGSAQTPSTPTPKNKETKASNDSQQHGFYRVDNSGEEKKKKAFKRTVIISLIIAAIITLISVIPSNDNSGTRMTNQDAAVMAAVRTYLKTTLKDPKSYEEIDWSPSGINNEGLYYIRHKYRAKNSFGGYVVEQYVFFVDKNYNCVRQTPY